MTDLPAQDPAATAGAEPDPTPDATPDATSEGSPTIRLWLARDMLIASLLLGFPGGFGLAARNAWRLGRRSTAWLLLGIGAAVFAVWLFIVPDDVTAGAALLVNVAVAGGLYPVLQGQVRRAAAAGLQVERAGAASGVATFIGGWIATAGPSLVLLFGLIFLGAQVSGIVGDSRVGTVAFGASGAGCSLEAPATSFSAGRSFHYVAYLSRQVRAGETIHVSVRSATGSEVGSEDLAVTDTADCVNATLPAFALSSGTYTFEFTVAGTRLAIGEVMLTAP